MRPFARRALTRRGLVGISAAIALLCALWSVFSISLTPPGVQMRHVGIAGAATHVIVDAPQSWILDKRRGGADFDALARHADLLANLMTSEPVRQIMAQRAAVPPERLFARTRLTGKLVAILREPDLEQRANQILFAGNEFRIDVQADPLRPIVHVYAQAPEVPAAIRVANAAVTALQQYLRAYPDAATVQASLQPRVQQLGPARGAMINSGAQPQIVLLTFLVAFGLSCGLLMLVGHVRNGWVAAARTRVQPADDTTVPLPPIVAREDDWPHTSRSLPWMVAAFLGLLWLVPFNTIELAASGPVDLKLDRLVLPFLVVVWILSLAAGGREAPRPRMTAIHVGVGVFLAAASLSVVLNAHSLNNALEFDLSSKKLFLLGSYICFFLLISSVIRRSEVPAFIKLTLILAVVCALGTVWEYRFHYNVFYDLADKLLPGFFTVGKVFPGEVDDIGRSLTRGPAEHPLETTAMLSMALPIALVGLLRSERQRTTILYGFAACLLLAAAISTYRKSALLAPLSVILTLAYFQRSQLLQLAPLAAVAAVVVHFLSPGAFGSIAVQLRPDRFGVGTISDRAGDYDAVRPDLWTHLVFGRGFGSYDHTSYHILDSEVLGLLVTLGIVGMICYLAMLVTIVVAARRPIRSRDPIASAAALAIAPAAVAFMVVSFLFDVLSFPHGPYIVISLAGLLAVILKSTDTEETSTDDGRSLAIPAVSAAPGSAKLRVKLPARI